MCSFSPTAASSKGGEIIATNIAVLPIFLFLIASLFAQTGIVFLALIRRCKTTRSSVQSDQPTEQHPSLQSDQLSPTHDIQIPTVQQDLFYKRLLGMGTFGKVMLGKYFPIKTSTLTITNIDGKVAVEKFISMYTTL